MSTIPPELTELLILDRTALQQQLFKREDKILSLELRKYCREMKTPADMKGRREMIHVVTDFLSLVIKREVAGIQDLRSGLAGFNQKLLSSSTEQEKQEHILSFAARMGADKRELRKDRKAFRRWFGADTVIERCQKRISGAEYRIVDLLDRLAKVVVEAIRNAADEERQKTIWGRIDLEKVTRNLLVHQGDPRVRRAAFACLAQGISSLPFQYQLTTLQEVTVTFIYRSAMERREDVWIQCEALNLLALTEPEAFLQALDQRLGQPGEGDDIFVRRRAVHLLGKYDRFHRQLGALATSVINDPSPFVRQALATALGDILCSKDAKNRREAWQWLRQLILDDREPQVRAAGVLTLSRAGIEASGENLTPSLLAAVMSKERDTFVLTTALEVAVEGLELRVEKEEQDTVDSYSRTLRPCIRALHQAAEPLGIRRAAALAREQMTVMTDPVSRKLKKELIDLVQGMDFGERRRVPGKYITRYGEEHIGRVLSVLSQKDFSYSLHSGVRGNWIVKGDVFSFRLWRLLFEFRHPKTDKRQGHVHTIGRHFRGWLYAPSAILGELTQTRVPGEPLFMETEESWRPYLPLPDQVLSCLQNPFWRKPVKVYSAEGVTAIHPSRSILRRLLGAARLTLQFDRFARKRNYVDDGSAKPEEYVRALEELGVRIVFVPHKDVDGVEDRDPGVQRFFLLPIPLAGGDWFFRIRDYFFSVYENSLYDLAVFSIGLLLFFVGSRFIMSRIAIRSRRKIDLVVGGWGTRGKSGTERLKAALFEGLGHSLVSKSTGCEAMFLYAYPFGKTREMFLFRPYDKATIWEQYDVVRLSNRLSTRVFLWECMALSSDYVRILQHQWMRDDYSTITNTYPDHEDLQGPAGYNIPVVMTQFIPKRGNLLTTEEQMLPILEMSARKKNTRFQSVGRRQAGLLAPDILARFPYEEHPYNIALVVAMAEELGIDPDFTLKEMADRVIADIGVLKAFPVARVRQRSLQFISGMSANERFGAMSNWKRMGFDDHAPYKEPGTILSTVVNNRADRVSRSLMFAGILVDDFSADLHFLIGSNLKGLVGYIHEALDAFCARITLQPVNSGPDHRPVRILEEAARRQRIPISEEEIQLRLSAMLTGVGIPEDRQPGAAVSGVEELQAWIAEQKLGELGEEILADYTRQKENVRAYQELYGQVQGAGGTIPAELDEQVRTQVRRWYLQKIIVIEDYHATGDQVVDRICRHTPPGLKNRIMGLQNIKGTGLDFVYRWQAWEACFLACEQLKTAEGAEFDRALHELSSFQEFGLLSEHHVAKACAAAQERSVAQNEGVQAEIALIRSNMENVLDKITSDLSGAAAVQKKSVVRENSAKLIHFLESMIDAGDAVRRRKRANRIYRDLADERISGERAVKELKALNRRQKGGWLWAEIQRLFL